MPREPSPRRVNVIESKSVVVSKNTNPPTSTLTSQPPLRPTPLNLIKQYERRQKARAGRSPNTPPRKKVKKTAGTRVALGTKIELPLPELPQTFRTSHLAPNDEVR